MRCGWFVVPSWLAGVSLFGLVCFASCSGDASNLVETDVTTGAADTPPTFIDTAGSSDARVDPDGGATQDIAEPLLDTQSADVTLADAPPASGDAAPFLDVDPSDEDLGSAETLSSADVPALIDVDEPDTGPTITCTAVASVLSPLAGEFFATGTDIEFKAQVVDPSESWPLTDHVVRWTLENGAVLGETAVSADGSASWTGAISISGPLTLQAVVRHSSGAECDGAPGQVAVRLCEQRLDESFDAALDPMEWLTSGDAYWDLSGWLEVTGNSQGRQGAIYSVTPKVAPGSVSIRLRFATGGGGDFTGADGFAVSFMKAESLEEMVGWIELADGGGGLGYGNGGDYGAFDGDAFTVEIDTWQNVENDSELHSDPTASDHLELTQGLDPESSLGFYDLGDVEDLNWHSVRVDIAATQITVWYDGAVALDKDVPDFQFRGGYVFFSGSTGYYSNFHRFDDLEILHDCEK